MKVKNIRHLMLGIICLVLAVICLAVGAAGGSAPKYLISAVLLLALGAVNFHGALKGGAEQELLRWTDERDRLVAMRSCQITLQVMNGLLFGGAMTALLCYAITRRSLGGQGLRLLIGEQAQIRRMEGGGNAQPLHKQGGVLNVVQVAVGQHDQPHPGPQAGIQQALHVAGVAGVHQDGALLPLHQIAVHIAAGDAADAPHRTTPLRVFPSSPSSCTCTRQL